MGPSPIRQCRKTLRSGLVAAIAFVFALVFAGAALAQKAPPAAERDPGKLYLDADKLIYDKNRDVVTADGGVVLYYKGRVLQGRPCRL